MSDIPGFFFLFMFFGGDGWVGGLKSGAGVTVYLAPLDSLPPGGQAVPGYLASHPGYLHARGGKLSRPVYLAPCQHKKNIYMIFCYFSVSF